MIFWLLFSWAQRKKSLFVPQCGTHNSHTVPYPKKSFYCICVAYHCCMIAGMYAFRAAVCHLPGFALCSAPVPAVEWVSTRQVEINCMFVYKG